MNSKEINDLRDKISSKLYAIQVLKSKLEKLEDTPAGNMEITISLCNTRIEDNFLSGKPIKEFIRHQMIIQYKKEIKMAEKQLQYLTYKSD